MQTLGPVDAPVCASDGAALVDQQPMSPPRTRPSVRLVKLTRRMRPGQAVKRVMAIPVTAGPAVELLGQGRHGHTMAHVPYPAGHHIETAVARVHVTTGQSRTMPSPPREGCLPGEAWGTAPRIAPGAAPRIAPGTARRIAPGTAPRMASRRVRKIAPRIARRIALRTAPRTTPGTARGIIPRVTRGGIGRFSPMALWILGLGPVSGVLGSCHSCNVGSLARVVIWPVDGLGHEPNSSAELGHVPRRAESGYVPRNSVMSLGFRSCPSEFGHVPSRARSLTVARKRL